jgi:hypothetical protein
MVEEPVQIVEALVDDVFIDGSFVFDDDRETVLIDAQGIDATTVRLSGGVFALKERDPEQLFQVLLDLDLERFFKCDRRPLELTGFRPVYAKDSDVAHGFTSSDTFPRPGQIAQVSSPHRMHEYFQVPAPSRPASSPHLS